MTALLDRDRWVFHQKTKIIELNTEFEILDEDGTQIGMVRQEGQSQLKKIARLATSLDQFMTHTLAVYDEHGAKVVELTRPRKVFKSSLLVKDAAGVDVGKIVQQNMVGKIRFALEDGSGVGLGSLNGENWRAWNFSIRDAAGQEVGRITKTWEGLLRTAFTTADHYLLEVTGPIDPAMRPGVLAAAAGVDLALKQDARGLN
ncbi:MAG: LURP-one-related/scramblase family protein [Actinomycetota bacterium]